MVQKIMVCGYLCSGKTALFDFLTDQKGVGVFPGRELRIFRATHGLNMLYNDFHYRKQTSEESLQKFAAFCSGNGETVRPLDVVATQNMRTLQRYFGPFFEKKVNAFIKKVRANPTNKKVFIKASRALLDSLCNEAARRQGVDTIVINQAMRPWALRYLRCFGNADIYIVRRDIRDQIVDRIGYGHSARDIALVPSIAEDIVKKIKKTESFIKNKASLYDHHRLHQVWFEDFVDNKDGARDRILARFGLPWESPLKLRLAHWLSWFGFPSKLKFNPYRSNRNLLMYRNDPELISMLDASYAKYFYKHGTSLQKIIKGFFRRKKKGHHEGNPHLKRPLINNDRDSDDGVLRFSPNRVFGSRKEGIARYKHVQIISTKTKSLLPGLYKIESANFNAANGEYEVLFLVNGVPSRQPLQGASVSFKLLD